jgi:sigma-B regulation protein RsbU (phosphoserine phosphatase)
MANVTTFTAHPGAVNESLDSLILHVLMETIPDRIYFKDLHSCFVRVNQAYATWHRFGSPDEVIGKTDFDLFSLEHAEAAFAGEQEIIRTGQPIIGRVEHITKQDGTKAWGSTTKMAWRDAAGVIIGTFGLTRDITATQEAEEKLVAERNLFQTIIDHLPSRIFVKDAFSRYVLNNRAHLELLGLKQQEDASGRTTLDFFPGERGHQAMADDQGVLSGGPPVLAQEKTNFVPDGGVRWSLTTKVPLRDTEGNITGLVGISHDITRRKLAEEELQRRTDEMEVDVQMARQIQETFLPHTYPVFPRGVPAESSALRFAHRYIPATTLGGDFFDIIQLSDLKCGVLVCDVMGHGVRAGLLTALIRGVVGEMGERAENPAHVLAEINRCLLPVLEQTGQPVFATAFFGVIDTAANTLVYCNGGHPPPLVVPAGSKALARLVPADPEPAAGLVPGFVYTRHECKFLPGDLFLGYTDGVLEAGDATGQFYGEERLEAFLQRSRGLAGREISARLVQDLEAYSGRSVFEDDVCFVAIESTGTTCALQPINYEI